MKKRSILLLALIPVLLTGCANKSVDKFEEETVMEEFESAIDTAETVEAQTKETEVEETNEVEEIEETEVSEEFSERVKNRESTLLKAAKFVDFLSTDKNIMFSPLSLDMVLGMAQSGTSNESKLSLDKSLGTVHQPTTKVVGLRSTTS